MRKGILFLSLVLAVGCASEGPTPRASSGAPEAVSSSFPAVAAGTDICAALGTPATVPAIQAGRPDIRVLAFGDFGDGSDSQERTAQAMAAYHRDHRFDFGLTLGDNFYERGINDVGSKRWDTQWEDLYSPLGIRVYATFGNHDHRDARSLKAEVERSSLSKTWCLPRAYYTFTAGPVQFFALDTTPIEGGDTGFQAQLDWLRGALRASRAPWKVVYGHHPVYTNGEHGGSQGYLKELRDRLFPVLREEKADVYLAGHDHDLESLKPLDGVSFFVSGGGGKEKRPLRSSRCRDWAVSAYGFTVLEATDDELTVRFIGSDGQPLHATTLRKGEPVEDCPRS